MAYIQLTKNKVAFVSIIDYDDLTQYRWCYCPNGTAQRRDKNGVIYMHRQILAARPGELVDHINGDRLDNRRENLRLVSKSLNTLNRHIIDRRSTTGLTGVYFHPTKQYWYGQFKFGEKKYYVPSRPTREAVFDLRKQMMEEVCHAKFGFTR